MALLSFGSQEDVVDYDEADEPPMRLVGEGAPGDAMIISVGTQIRPVTPGSGSGPGDVARFGVSVNNRIARWHNADPEIQNTGVTIDDSDNISGYGTLTGGSNTIPITDGNGNLRLDALQQNGATNTQIMTWNSSPGEWEPQDAPVGGGGDVSRSGGTSDRTFARWLGTGPTIFTSDVTCDDNNAIAGITNLTMVGVLNVGGAAHFEQHLFHQGDVDTYMQFQTNRVSIFAGAVGMIDCINAGQDIVHINQGSVDVDFQVHANSMAQAFFVEGSSGNIRCNADADDTTYTFGRAILGDLIALEDYFGLAHVDHASITNYAIIQSGVGQTAVNAATGRTCTLRVNNIPYLQVAGTTVTVLGTSLQIGTNSAIRGVLHVWDGAGGAAAGFIAMYSRNGTLYNLFVEDDGTLRLYIKTPVNNADGVIVGAQT